MQSALSLDNKFLENSGAYVHGLLTFINQWNTLRPIQRRKLLGKPLQLPLAVELCYLTEGINHDGLVCPYNVIKMSILLINHNDQVTSSVSS